MNPPGKIILKNVSLRCRSPYLTAIFIFLLTITLQLPAWAQVNTNIPEKTVGSLLPADSAAIEADSSLEQRLGVRIAEDALTDEVRSEAADSAVLNLKMKLFYLYRNAKVNYQDMQITAGTIRFDQASGVVMASPGYDSAGVSAGKPDFSQGREKFTYDTMQYNFQSKRAIVRNARTQQGEGYVISEQVKRNPDQSIYGYRNIYTTCALDTPHFGIRMQKIKVIPNRVIAAASANVVIEEVPTPLFLPFGLFPVNERQRSGFQLPTYTVEQQRGLGFTNGGYYFYLNDKVDFLALVNIYTKGSYSMSGISTYANRYRYRGGFSLSYAYNKTGESYEPGSSIDKDFRVVWNHSTDPKAKPGETFTASVNAGSRSYYANNSYNVNQILQNNYSSNVSYVKNWIGKPYSLTISGRYIQNTGTGITDLYLPEISFYVAQFNPLQRKDAIGTPRWYEKITMSYTLSAMNQTSFYDSTFNLGTIGFNDFRNGMKHTIPISASYNLLRFINLSFDATYTEYWMTARQHRSYNFTDEKVDTLQNRGFYTARDFSPSVRVSTRIYGLKKFRKGSIMGIRHVLTPNAAFTYTPDFSASPFNYYYQTRLDTSSRITYLSPYEGSIIGTPGMGQYGNFASNISFGLNNNLQIKVRSRNDTSGKGKNITLIDQLSITGSYNVAADSFNWSQLNVDFRTNILDKVSISGNARFDPYGIDYHTGRRLTRTLLETGDGLARFMQAGMSLNASFRSKPSATRDPSAVRTDEFTNLMAYGGYNNYVDFNIPWSVNISYTMSVNNNYQANTFRDTLIWSHNAMFSGDFNLTPKWKITFSSGYNFTTKQLSMTSIDIYRDMHCWEMRLGMIPFGPRKNYNFTLNVKASVLQDLKLVRRRDFRDAVY